MTGVATTRIPTHHRRAVPSGHCRWCGEPIDRARHPRARSWHPRCAEEWRDQQPAVMRARVWWRDGGRCEDCGQRVEDREARRCGQAYWRAIRGLPGIPSPNCWGRWREGQALTMPAQRDLPGTRRSYQAGHHLWEADHRVSLWAGGANTLENLRVCCMPCHRAKTRREARERAQRRGAPDGQIALVP